MECSGEQLERLLKYLTVRNKSIEQSYQKWRIWHWAYKKQRDFELYDKDYKGVIVPQQYKNNCYPQELITIDWTKEVITLRPKQKDLMEKIREVNSRYATIIAQTWFGKTIIMTYMILKARQKTLVLVPTIAIGVQTKETFEKYWLGTGMYWGWKQEIEKDVVVMIGASFGKMGKRALDSMRFRMLLVDECDKFLTEKLIKNMIRLETNFVYAFTATPSSNKFNKSDNVFEKIYWPTIWSQEVDIKPNVIYYEYKNSYKILPDTYSQDRKKFLDSDTIRIWEMKRIVIWLLGIRKHILVLFDRVTIVEEFAETIKMCGRDKIHTIIWDRTIEEREKTKKDFSKNWWLLIATDQTVWRGFDVKEIDTVCVFFPNKFDWRVIQMVGRALRICPWKFKPLVVDFHDSALVHQSKARMRIFRKYYKVEPILKTLI